jgi:hypothetical protein
MDNSVKYQYERLIQYQFTWDALKSRHVLNNASVNEILWNIYSNKGRRNNNPDIIREAISHYEISVNNVQHAFNTYKDIKNIPNLELFLAKALFKKAKAIFDVWVLEAQNYDQSIIQDINSSISYIDKIMKNGENNILLYTKWDNILLLLKILQKNWKIEETKQYIDYFHKNILQKIKWDEKNNHYQLFIQEIQKIQNNLEK